MYLIVIILIAVLSFLIWASADIRSGIYIKTLYRKETNKKVVAITFDDGPDPCNTEQVLEVLDIHNVRATFFLIGKNAEAHKELARKIVKCGHTIGIHTYSHASFSPFFSFKRYNEEIVRTQEIIENIIHKKPRLFRPPFGVTNPTIAKATRQIPVIGWSIRSLDTNSFLSREKICLSITKKVRNGDVILLHDRCKDSDILTDAIITKLKEKGFEFKKIDELFEIDAYDK